MPAGSTPHFGLTTLGADAPLSTDGYKYVRADRNLIDVLLYLALTGHSHTGAAGSTADPTLAPTSTTAITGGNIAAGQTVRYRYTWVSADGLESAASPELVATTPAAINTPGAAALAFLDTSGTLTAGGYFYQLSAYVGASTTETAAGTATALTIAAGEVGKVQLTLPTTPFGATGFNVYRRAPGSTTFAFLASIDTSVITPPTTYDDDGSATEDCNRVAPNANNTNSANAITVTLPGATPAAPVGYTWKLYRTLSGVWDNSLLVWETGAGIVSAVDTGQGTLVGKYPSTSQFVSSPAQVDLTDAAEVTGTLPIGAVSGYPQVTTFAYPGTLTATTGTYIWICEHPNISITGVRACLAYGATPSAQPVLVDVNKVTFDAGGGVAAKTTIFTTQANRPSVPIAKTRGPLAVPDTTDLALGEGLTVDIDQAGGGATPGDADLIVTVHYVAYGFDPTTSFVA